MEGVRAAAEEGDELSVGDVGVVRALQVADGAVDVERRRGAHLNAHGADRPAEGLARLAARREERLHDLDE